MPNYLQSQKKGIPFMYFGIYCFGGLSMLSYVTYKTFSKASMRIKVDKPKGQRLRLSGMGSYPGLLKGMALMGVYLAGFGYLTMNLKLEDRLFKTMIQKDEEYTKRIKIDPIYQDFLVINIMHYFGISDRLIKKTETELRQKSKGYQLQEEKQGVMVKLQKSFVELAQSMSGQKSEVK